MKQDIDRERKSMQGLEKLAMAIKQTPTFGTDDSQQNVADKLYHVSDCLSRDISLALGRSNGPSDNLISELKKHNLQ